MLESMVSRQDGFFEKHGLKFADGDVLKVKTNEEQVFDSRFETLHSSNHPMALRIIFRILQKLRAFSESWISHFK